MTALDSCEPQIIHALEKDGWQIINKPYTIPTEQYPVYADFRSRRVEGGSEQTIVVIEVKCFTDPKADLTELYTAVGQYHYYRVSLSHAGLAQPLYLALPQTAYQRFLTKPSFIDTLITTGVKLLVVDTLKEEIFQWVD